MFSDTWQVIFMWFQIVPGRMGMLVTLFLSLTALLVSTISSSPEVKYLKETEKNPWTMFELDYDVIQNKLVRICFRRKIRRIDHSNYSGVPRNIGPDLLGACSLFLHIRCNCCLWESTCHTQVRVFVHFLYSIQNVIAKILSRRVWI